MATPISKNKSVCMACRARKKRCDAQRPSCSSCRRRNEHCSYLPSHLPSSIAALTAALAQRPPSPFHWDAPFPPPTSFLVPPDPPTGKAFAWPTPGASLSNSSSTAPSATSPLPLHDLLLPYLGSDQHEAPDFWMSPLLESDPPAAISQGSSLLPTLAHERSPPERLPDDRPAAPLETPQDSATPSSEPAAPFPPRETLLELVDIFFDRFYTFLPIFHRRELASMAAAPAAAPPLLLYAVLAVTAGNHPDPQVRAFGTSWYEEAKDLYGSTPYQPEEPLRTLQAAACIILQALMVGEHSTAWLVLGRAWRQAVALGFHRLDSDEPPRLPNVTQPLTLGWRELEQARRTIWALFMFDRGMCFPVGLAHAVDERQLRVTLPMSEDGFQARDLAPDRSNKVYFTHNPKRLIARILNGPRDLSHFVILAYLLLGRIVEHMHSAEHDQDDRDAELECLEECLSQVRLSLPRSATDLATASHTDFPGVVWLNVLMDVNTVFLFHRPQRGGEAGAGPASRWQHCLAVARNTAAVIRSASRISTDLLMNPNIAAPIFTCARVLVIEHLLPPASPDPSPSASAALRADLDVLLLFFDRLSEAFGGVGNKFRNGVLYHLQQSAESAREIKARGSRELLTSCGKWPTLAEAKTGTVS